MRMPLRAFILIWLSMITALLFADQAKVDGKPNTKGNDELHNRTLQVTLQITAIQLVDVATAIPILNITSNNNVINLATVKATSLTIIAKTSNGVGSVKFGLGSNANFNTESKAPYSFCGNDGMKLFQCPWLVVGTHTLTVTPYSEDSCGGIAGTTRRVTLSIVNNPLQRENDSPCTIPKVS